MGRYLWLTGDPSLQRVEKGLQQDGLAGRELRWRGRMGNAKDKGDLKGKTTPPHTCPVLCAPDLGRLGCRKSECLASALRTYFSPNTFVSVSALDSPVSGKEMATYPEKVGKHSRSRMHKAARQPWGPRLLFLLSSFTPVRIPTWTVTFAQSVSFTSFDLDRGPFILQFDFFLK